MGDESSESPLAFFRASDEKAAQSGQVGESDGNKEKSGSWDEQDKYLGTEDCANHHKPSYFDNNHG